MSATGTRALRRATSEAAILDAAWTSVARHGPDGTSLRDVAEAAGCTHTLVARYFGPKDDLVGAVGAHLAARVGAAVDDLGTGTTDELAALLAAARRDRPAVQLLVRAALGDLRPTEFPACLRAERLLAPTPASASGGRHRAAPAPPPPGRHARRCAYATASLLLGWLTFEGFAAAGTGLDRLGPARRDAAIAGVAGHLLVRAGTGEPPLRRHHLVVATALRRAPVTADASASARDRLLASAIELFAEHGPASVSVRDVGRHAGVNQGLIYRHFGSKEALLAAAIEQGSSGLFPAALAEDGFDFDAMSHLLHHRSAAPRLIARTLVDDVDIRTVRPRFPVLARVLADARRVDPATRPPELADPRVVAAAAASMALGSAIWARHLQRSLGMTADGIEVTVADVARYLVGGPATVPALMRRGRPGR